MKTPIALKVGNKLVTFDNSVSCAVQKFYRLTDGDYMKDHSQGNVGLGIHALQQSMASRKATNHPLQNIISCRMLNC